MNRTLREFIHGHRGQMTGGTPMFPMVAIIIFVSIKVAVEMAGEPVALSASVGILVAVAGTVLLYIVLDVAFYTVSFVVNSEYDGIWLSRGGVN